MENRFRYHQLPTFEGFGTLFARFKGGPLGYWHDTGHDHAYEALGLVPPGAHLEAYSDKLVGIHLHDVFGLDDPLPPGKGEIDFGAIQSHLGPDTLRVLELKPKTPDPAVARGIGFLRQKMGA